MTGARRGVFTYILYVSRACMFVSGMIWYRLGGACMDTNDRINVNIPDSDRIGVLIACLVCKLSCLPAPALYVLGHRVLSYPILYIFESRGQAEKKQRNNVKR